VADQRQAVDHEVVSVDHEVVSVDHEVVLGGHVVVVLASETRHATMLQQKSE
jgi:hypothetical protein